MAKFCYKKKAKGIVINSVVPDNLFEDVVIPTEINGTKVISINKRAFVDGEIVKEEGPETCAFPEDRILFNSVTIPNGVELSEKSFVMASVKEVYLPASVIQIPEFCFLRSRVEKVVFEDPQKVTYICVGAFDECKYLTHFEWPAGCKEMSGCFAGAALESINGIEELEAIAGGAFQGTRIKEFKWPAKCKIIPTACFMGSHLQKITGIENVEDVGMLAFAETKFLTGEFKWPRKAQTIPKDCFQNSAISGISGIDSVTEILPSAFRSCANIKTIQWPLSCKTIPPLCFWRSGLESISNLERVEDISTGSFADCYGLKTVKLGDRLNSVSVAAFIDEKSLASIPMIDVTECDQIKILINPAYSEKTAQCWIPSNPGLKRHSKRKFISNLTIHELKKRGEKYDC